MVSRREFLKTSTAAIPVLATMRITTARAKNAPGVTDTEIKIGQTLPYSGPASAYSALGRAEAAYFKTINEAGGINGRKLNFISVDDGFNPAKTVEQTRRLVEQEHVALIFGSAGTAHNAATRSYLNDNKVPQLFISTGSPMFADPKHFPWTMPGILSFETEAKMFARHILASKQDAKIGLLYLNDGFGQDVRAGLRESLGPTNISMIIKEASYENTDPLVDSQVETLQGAGVDTLIIAALPKAAAQALRKSYDMGWRPLRYLTYTANSIATVLKPAGLEKAQGAIGSAFLKDPSDPRWRDDPGLKQWEAFVASSMTPADLLDFPAVGGWGMARMLVQVLTQCGDDLSAENIMRQAANLKDFRTPMLLPGVTINTSPENYLPIRQLQMMRFNGVNWDLVGDVMTD